MRDNTDDQEEIVSLGNTADMRSSSVGTLRHLGDLDDVKLAEGAPDVRGWKVKSTDGETLGKVADLLVDTGVMKVRYLEVELDKDVAERTSRTEGATVASARRRADDDLDAFRHVLVPIGRAHLDDDNDEVRLDGNAQQLSGIPDYRRGNVSRDYERGLIGSYTGAPADTQSIRDSANDDFYASENFDDRSFFRRKGTPLEGNEYLSTRRASSRPGSQLTGGGPLASDDVQPQLDPRPGSVGDSRI